ncbi:Myb/SANT-like domain [Sesbania bispinosa]|nr:Myb/SANT-like domain [Sesbania bispinosa]
MVVADDCVWDAYLRDHPDARCYRTKPVLNFDDLCMIYGYIIADGRYSLSSHDVNLDDQGQGLHLPLGDGMGSTAVSSNERPMTDWTSSMDQFFVELLLDQMGRGNKVNNSFNKKAWTDMLAMFNAKFGTQHVKRILKNRFKKLLKCYCDITNLLKQGFSWNEQQRMLSADDGVWDAYIKVGGHANVPCEGKGSRNSSGTDRTRTCWTPAMDRCLIDLLVEQAKRGNRLGQTFISQAWNDMTTSFNEQFKSQYDKDVLKNRYKHFKKQFNDVDNLLQQDGFSWDDTREMVHPEARSLRVKTLPGYRKLCVIFREGSSDTRYIRLSHEADPSCELSMLITEWTESMEICFVDLMIEQVNRGTRLENSFSEQAWIHMTEAFRARLGLQCDKQFLIFGNKVMKAFRARVIAQDQLLLMEANDIAIEMDLEETCGNLAVISNVDISDHDIDRPREMDMDGSSGNLLVSGRTEISSQDNRRPSEVDIVGTSGSFDVTCNNEISNQDAERPREMVMDITYG